MNRVLCQFFATGLLLAGCQSGLFQTAAKKPVKTNQPGEKATSPWMDGEPIADRRGGGRADVGTPRRRPGRSEADSDLNMANDALRHGRLDEAKSLYRLVLAKDRTNASAHHRLATIADRQGDYRTANDHYEVALEQRPRDSELLNDVGWSYFLQKRYAESERYLQRAITADRNNKKAMRNLGWLYGVQQRTDLARRMFLRAGTPAEAERMMARLRQTVADDQRRMLADGSSRRQPGDVRAPDPSLSRRSGNRNVNAELRRRMDEARERDLATRGGDDNRYQMFSRSQGSDGRYADAPNTRRDERPAERGDAPYRGGQPPRDGGIASRGTSNGDLNGEMRRIDGYSGNRRPADYDDTRASGVRNSGYDAPRSRTTDRGGYESGRFADPRDSNSRDAGAGRTTRGPNDNLFPPDDREPYVPRHTIRHADSQRALPSGADRGQSPPSVDPAHRDALRLGHNTGAGGVPFPIPDRSRTERTLPAADRDRRSLPDARRPIAPAPWRGGERNSANRDDRPIGGSGRGDGGTYDTGMSRDFDGPVIRPRSKDSGIAAGYSEPVR